MSCTIFDFGGILMAICGSVQSQYKQVGNAVPVNLAYEIGLEIHKSLERSKNGETS